MVQPIVPIAVRTLIAPLPQSAWRRVMWRNGAQPKRHARFTAVRVPPAHQCAVVTVPRDLAALRGGDRTHTSAEVTTSSTCHQPRPCERSSD
jgi:hypothetical protein